MSTHSVSSASVPAARSWALLTGGILVVWFGLVVAVAATGGFVTPIGQPPLSLLAGVVLPLFLFGLLYGVSRGFREFVRDGDPLFLTTLQSWRVLGAVFVVLFLFGMLPGPFALPAGLGDFAVGVAAPFVARAVAGRDPVKAWPLFLTFNLLGLLDLIVAISSGASVRFLAGGTEPAEQMVLMAQLPLTLIPAFAVPVFVILHLASLIQFRARMQHAAA
jgi:hypothetical protein